jgi:DNA-binding NarL/FixJ family response regulator
MDLHMPRCDGVEATGRLRELDPNIKVLGLTRYADDRAVSDALRAGARGYLTKDTSAEEIRNALDQVMRDHAGIDPAAQHHLIEVIAAGPVRRKSARAPQLPDGPTPCESEVRALIAVRLANRPAPHHRVNDQESRQSPVRQDGCTR